MYKKMNAKIKKQWIEALESSKYRQGPGRLKFYDSSTKKSKFCCLGVLCEVAGIEAKNEGEGVFTYDGSPDTLSEKLRKRFGISPSTEQKLIDMNDGEYNENTGFEVIYKFKQIANWIKKNI